jgi:NAD(P)-dependent dehydrogenase (short-subunit alcohol dehydrogenase family)
MSTMAGKVALVTGGTSGIGLATARVFAARGAVVVIAGRDAERGQAAVASLGAGATTAYYAQADVSDGVQVERLVSSIVDRHGRLDYAFNNAASAEVGIFKLTADFPEDEWQRAMQLNMTSVWLCMKHEIVQMLAQGGGAIVNTSSVNGLGGVPGAAPYAAAKAAVLALTKSAAMEYATRGIRVNALVAGAFETPLLRTAIDRHARGDPAAVAEAERRYTDRVPLGRIGDAREAAEAAVWLCSDAASYVTGHSMIVDGGMSAWAR